MSISAHHTKPKVRIPSHARSAAKSTGMQRQPHCRPLSRARRPLLLEKSEILRRQNALALEFEHRLLNSLQLVTDMLTMQCRTAPTPERPRN